MINSKHEAANIFGSQSELTTETVTQKVSVIIPAYNTAAYIAETLDSVFTQTYTNYEVIVINDGSPHTKALEAALETYRDRIIYLKQENQGAGPARNTGLKASSGKLIAFLDSDDIWLPKFLESQVTFLQENKFDLVWADAYLFGIGVREGSTFMEFAPSEGEATFESLLESRCNIITSGTLARKKAILEVGGFKNYPTAQDFDLWVRMALKGARFGYRKDILLKHRVHLKGLSGNSVKRIERELNAYNRLLETLPLNKNQVHIVECQLKRLEASLLLERGKSLLLDENYIDAKRTFKEANKYFRSIKLRAVLIMLNLFPRLLLWLFKWLRADGLALIKKSNPKAV